MPIKQNFYNNLPAFMQLSHMDWALWHFALGLRFIAPTVTDKQCIDSFYDQYGISEDDFPRDRMYVKFSKIKQDYAEFEKREKYYQQTIDKK